MLFMSAIFNVYGLSDMANYEGGYDTGIGVQLTKDDLAAAYRAFQRFDKDGSGAIDTKVHSMNSS